MGGLLTHLSIAITGFLIGTFIFENYRYGIAFGIGHLIPDLIDFGSIALFTGKFNPARLITSPWFQPLARLGHTWWHWVIFGVIFFIIIFSLYKFKKIKQRKFGLLFRMLLFFLAGTAVHLIVDLLVIEKSFWI